MGYTSLESDLWEEGIAVLDLNGSQTWNTEFKVEVFILSSCIALELNAELYSSHCSLEYSDSWRTAVYLFRIRRNNDKAIVYGILEL